MDNETTKENGQKSNGGSHKKTARIAEAPEALTADFETILEQVGDSADEILSEITETVEKTVRKYPVQSVLVCLGVGALLGALWNSRR